jgi:NADP-dependent 3-hydroxy acid dehydrogenase YdfG
VVVTARGADKLAETAKLVENLGRRSLAVPADVTVYDDCERVVTETMTELGRVDILVNYVPGSGTVFGSSASRTASN